MAVCILKLFLFCCSSPFSFSLLLFVVRIEWHNWSCTFAAQQTTKKAMLNRICSVYIYNLQSFEVNLEDHQLGSSTISVDVWVLASTIFCSY